MTSPTKYVPVDLELIEYVDDRTTLDTVDAMGIVKPNAVLINGNRVRLPQDSTIVIEPIAQTVKRTPADDSTDPTMRVTMTLYVRSLNMRAEISPAAL
jgi:hypothetical protein